MRFFGNPPTLRLESSIPLPYSINSLANVPIHTRLPKYQVKDNLDRQIGGSAIDKKAIRVYLISIDDGKELLIADPWFQNHYKNSAFHSQLKGITICK